MVEWVRPVAYMYMALSSILTFLRAGRALQKRSCDRTDLVRSDNLTFDPMRDEKR